MSPSRLGRFRTNGTALMRLLHRWTPVAPRLRIGERYIAASSLVFPQTEPNWQPSRCGMEGAISMSISTSAPVPVITCIQVISS